MLNQLIERFGRLPLSVKMILLVIIAIGAGYTSWGDYVEPAKAALDTAVAEDQQLATELENLNKSGQSLTAIESTRRKTEDEFRALFELLPKEVDIDKLLAGFADAARESGSILKQFQPTKPGGDQVTPAFGGVQAAAGAPGAAPAPATFGIDSLEKFTIKVVLEGSYTQIALFFDKVLGMPRIVRLDNFKIEPLSTTGAPVYVTPKPAQMVFGAGAQEASAISQKLSLRTSVDGSTILGCTAQFTSYTQKGDLPALAALSAPTQAAATAPEATPAGSDSAAAPPDNGGSENSLSAKPLESPSGGKP